jgi:hypothetical protein
MGSVQQSVDNRITIAEWERDEMSNYHLAQLNIARLLAPLDSPQLADFVANLDRVNALAESAPGFVWRLQTDEGDATALRPLGEDTIVNMSVWEDVAALNQFVYRSAHVDIMRRRKEWFERMAEAYAVLWWIPKAHMPTIDEALGRLEHLRAHGASQRAFTFRQPFAAPDESDAADPSTLLDECPT